MCVCSLLLISYGLEYTCTVWGLATKVFIHTFLFWDSGLGGICSGISTAYALKEVRRGEYAEREIIEVSFPLENSLTKHDLPPNQHPDLLRVSYIC